MGEETAANAFTGLNDLEWDPEIEQDEGCVQSGGAYAYMSSIAERMLVKRSNIPAPRIPTGTAALEDAPIEPVSSELQAIGLIPTGTLWLHLFIGCAMCRPQEVSISLMIQCFWELDIARAVDQNFRAESMERSSHEVEWDVYRERLRYK